MKETLENKRIFSNLPTINFVCIILIVFIHSYNASSYELKYDFTFGGVVLVIEDLISQGIAHVATPLFFAISGFLMFVSLEGNYTNKIKRRAKSLMVPYLLWNSIYFAIFFIMTNVSMISAKLNSVEHVSLSFSSILMGVLFYKQNYIMWFIYQLMIYHIMSIAFLYILRNKFCATLCFIALVGLYSSGYKEIPNNMPCPGIYPDMLFYYLVGGFFSIHEKIFVTFTQRVFNRKYMIIILIALWLFLWCINRAGYKEWRFDILNIIDNVIGVLVIFIFAFNMNIRKFDIPVAPFLIFAIHPFLLEVIQKIDWILFPHNSFMSIIDYVGSVIVCIIVIILIGRFAQNKIPKIYSILIGNR